ncbi:hypothetical protein BJ980_000427 [Nocardioides daedukensis]|uniref:Uncharacterized protein n=1 Tax=Nocardioides daedukensis TaxID=634462 RepID=A0A7Y9S0I3_9ACTN|nr:hypothetical protein [Nocardioides daedukensis]NYG57504.1 hypothetical protein [Nocardioides daedukensis]
MLHILLDSNRSGIKPGALQFAGETEIHTTQDTGDLTAQRHYSLPGGVSGLRTSDTTLDFLLTNPAGTDL